MRFYLIISLLFLSFFATAQIDQQTGSAFTQLDLQKRVGTKDGIQMKVGGMNVIGDGGGGTWRWDANSTATVVAGKVIQVYIGEIAQPVGRWVLVSQDIKGVTGLEDTLSNLTLQRALQKGNKITQPSIIDAGEVNFGIDADTLKLGGTSASKIGLITGPQSLFTTVAPKLNITVGRTGVILSSSPYNTMFKTIAAMGYEPTVTVNWRNQATGFPMFSLADSNAYKAAFTSFCDSAVKYGVRLLTGPNEWNNPNYWGSDSSDANANAIVSMWRMSAIIAHSKGLLYTDGGITGPRLKYLTYKWLQSKGRTAEATALFNSEFSSAEQTVINNNNYENSNIVNLTLERKVLARYPKQYLDFVNYHWYSGTGAGANLANPNTDAIVAAAQYLEETTGLRAINNEIGQQNLQAGYPSAILNRLSDYKMPYVVWWSGDGSGQNGENAKGLSDADGTLRSNGSNFSTAAQYLKKALAALLVNRRGVALPQFPNRNKRKFLTTDSLGNITLEQQDTTGGGSTDTTSLSKRIDERIPSVADIPALKAFVRGENKTVIVRDTLRGGVFQVVPSGSDDNGILFVANDGTRWKRQNVLYADIDYFGAVPGQDATIPIRQALASPYNLSVYVKERETPYYTTQQINITRKNKGKQFICEGERALECRVKGTTNNMFFVDHTTKFDFINPAFFVQKSTGFATYTLSYINFNYATNCNVTGGTLTSFFDSSINFNLNGILYANPTIFNAITMKNSSKISITGIRISDGFYTQVRNDLGTHDVLIENFAFHKAYRSIMGDSKNTYTGNRALDSASYNITIRKGTFDSIYLMTSKNEQSCDHWVYDDLDFNNTGFLSNHDGQDAVADIAMNATNSTVRNCRFNSKISNVTAGIQVYRGAANVLIENCTFDGNFTGVFIQRYNKNPKVINNTFLSAGGDGYGIYAQGGDNAQLTGNRFLNMPGRTIYALNMDGGLIANNYNDSSGHRFINLYAVSNTTIRDNINVHSGREAVLIEQSSNIKVIGGTYNNANTLNIGTVDAVRADAASTDIEINGVTAWDTDTSGHARYGINVAGVQGKLSLPFNFVKSINADANAITSSTINWINGVRRSYYRTGTTAPTVTPHFIGDQYFNTTDSLIYSAFGTSVNDWRLNSFWKYKQRKLTNVDADNISMITSGEERLKIDANGYVEIPVRLTMSDATVSGVPLRMGNSTFGWYYQNSGNPTNRQTLRGTYNGIDNIVLDVRDRSYMNTLGLALGTNNNTFPSLLYLYENTALAGIPHLQLTQDGTGASYMSFKRGSQSWSAGMFTDSSYRINPDTSLAGSQFIIYPTTKNVVIGTGTDLGGNLKWQVRGSGYIGDSLYLNTVPDGLQSMYSLLWNSANKLVYRLPYNSGAVTNIRRVGVNWQIFKDGAWVTVATDSVGTGGNLNALNFSYGFTNQVSWNGSAALTQRIDTSANPINIATQGFVTRSNFWKKTTIFNGDNPVNTLLPANDGDNIGTTGTISSAAVIYNTQSTPPSPTPGQAIQWFDGVNVKITKNVGGTTTTTVIF